MMTNPYSDLPSHSFWKSGVADKHPSTIIDLYRKKFSIAKTDRIATAGSCFAQHVARHLKSRGYQILDAEPPPKDAPEKVAKKFGYLTYSGRYGNIYTARQFVQLLRDCQSPNVDPEDIWIRDGRFFDGLRPNVEPEGLDSAEEVRIHRLDHLRRIADMFAKTDILVFTLGLTEAWRHRETGRVYPTCPGVIAGAFDDQKHEFVNFGFAEILEDMKQARSMLKALNPGMRFLLTVSPVPLTATASDKHVLVATTYSKSVLRAVCGELEAAFDDVDYFPSYELIASPFSKGFFYDANQREVTEMGVQNVMRVFFSEHGDGATAPEGRAGPKIGKDGTGRPASATGGDDNDVVCEEALLAAFSK